MKRKLLALLTICCTPLWVQAQATGAVTGNKPASEPPVIEHIGMLTVDFCAGDCVPLSPQVSGTVTSFSWDIPDAATISAGSNYDVGACFDTAGSFPATLIVSNDFGSDSMTVYVYLYPNPEPVLTESEGVLTVAGAGIVYYTWFLNGAYLTGSTSNTLTPAVEGWYRCQAQAMGGCDAWTDSTFVTPASVPSVAANGKPAYWVAGQTLYSSQYHPKPVMLTIMDASGRKVWQKKVSLSQNQLLPYLPAGRYLIGIQQEQGRPVFLKYTGGN